MNLILLSLAAVVARPGAVLRKNHQGCRKIFSE
jgi:hypothetical protein